MTETLLAPCEALFAPQRPCLFHLWRVLLAEANSLLSQAPWAGKQPQQMQGGWVEVEDGNGGRGDGIPGWMDVGNG